MFFFSFSCPCPPHNFIQENTLMTSIMKFPKNTCAIIIFLTKRLLKVNVSTWTQVRQASVASQLVIVCSLHFCDNLEKLLSLLKS